MKNKPMLQAAMDTLDLNSALEVTRLIGDFVDIIEVGTILCLAEGLSAVETIKTLYPEHLVLADVRIAEAGALISKMVFDADADWVSIVSSASLSTMEVVAKEAFSRKRDVQIELQDDGWSLEKALKWQKFGIKQVTFHRSRDNETPDMSWSQKDIDLVRDLSVRGFKVSVTGKMTVSDIKSFKGVPVYAFVAGRSIIAANDPRNSAEAFKNAIEANWS